MSSPLVSIIIPVFNRPVEVKRAIESVLKQTYTNWECIVVDDGSTDNTFSVLQVYSESDLRIKVLSRKRNPKGAPTCRNTGLKLAKGKYVLFLDSDDCLLPHCLKQRVQATIRFPGQDFWIFPVAKLTKKGISKQDVVLRSNYLEYFLSADLPWTITNPFWKREVLLKIRGFSEGYPRFNDPELMIRVLLQPNVAFKILSHLPEDTVLNTSIKDSKNFYKQVFMALKLFIPDMVDNLKGVDRISESKFLIGYLRLWLKYYYAPNPEGKLGLSYNLLLMFYRLKVITFGKLCSLGGRLLHFHLTKVFGLGNRDKLTNRAYYLNY